MSRFVSAGTNDSQPERDDEWIQAQQELEANRRRKQDEDAASRQQDGKSLYEVLQANKAAKQEAFEEAVKFKNQFRALDEDEIDFLDSVLESTRAEEAAVKKDTIEQLDAFRRKREEAEKAAAARLEQDGGELVKDEEQWQFTGKKRKREKEAIVKGLKLRRSSSTASKKPESPPTLTHQDSHDAETAKAAGASIEIKEKAPAVTKETGDESAPRQSHSASPSNTAVAAPTGLGLELGLGAYSSDED